MPPVQNKAPLIARDHIYEIKGGIVFIERLIRVQYIVENLKRNIIERLEYTEGFSYPVIIFGQELMSMDKVSRDYLAGEGAKNTFSRAFVVEKEQGKLQLNFFVETNKQPVPTKIFSDLESAIEWSQQFRNQ
ncbi:MAG TPA: hypothetical protein VK809_00020 [Bacteroidia bacterium]|jgi:hypothetical protein|nr:hypothetical protein [Bacteroidia bacterium]